MKKALSLLGAGFVSLLLVAAEAGVLLELKSSAFSANDEIPRRFTCEGQDISVPLAWSTTPLGTKSWALVCDDPDAPMGTWVHWVVYNIPPERTQFSEGVEAKQRLEDGTRQGRTDFQRVGYGGPCPPPGRPHRYFFRLYALDTVLDFLKPPTRQDLLTAIKGHVLAEATLMGTYKR